MGRLNKVNDQGGHNAKEFEETMKNHFHVCFKLLVKAPDIPRNIQNYPESLPKITQKHPKKLTQKRYL